MSQEPINKLTEEEISELLKALGFHRIPSRARWRIKVSDSIGITDAKIRMANESGKLREILNELLSVQILRKQKLLEIKKTIILALTGCLTDSFSPPKNEN